MDLSEIPAGLTERERLTYLVGKATQVRLSLVDLLRDEMTRLENGSLFAEGLRHLAWETAHERSVIAATGLLADDDELREAVLDAIGDTYSALWDLSSLVERVWAPMQDDESTWALLVMGGLDQDNGGFEYSTADGFVGHITLAEKCWNRIFQIGWLIPRDGDPSIGADKREQFLRALRGLPQIDG